MNHTHLAQVNGGQIWVQEHGEFWWFPGGGTHFKHGASEYIQRFHLFALFFIGVCRAGPEILRAVDNSFDKKIKTNLEDYLFSTDFFFV